MQHGHALLKLPSIMVERKYGNKLIGTLGKTEPISSRAYISITSIKHFILFNYLFKSTIENQGHNFEVLS